MKDDKRSTATIILEKRRPSTPDSSGNNSEMNHEDDMYMIADEIMDAIKHSDTRALKIAMQSLMECYMNKEESSEPEEAKESSNSMEPKKY